MPTQPVAVIRGLISKIMKPKNAPKQATSKPEETKPEVSKMELHRAQAPADVKAAYELVAEYERRCP